MSVETKDVRYWHSKLEEVIDGKLVGVTSINQELVMILSREKLTPQEIDNIEKLIGKKLIACEDPYSSSPPYMYTIIERNPKNLG